MKKILLYTVLQEHNEIVENIIKENDVAKKNEIAILLKEKIKLICDKLREVN